MHPQHTLVEAEEEVIQLQQVNLVEVQVEEVKAHPQRPLYQIWMALLIQVAVVEEEVNLLVMERQQMILQVEVVVQE